MLRYLNKNKSEAIFNDAYVRLEVPGDFSTIGDVPMRNAVLAWLAKGNAPVELGAPTKAERIKTNIDAIQAELDRQAKDKGYDSIVSACSYAAGPDSDPFSAEGKAFLAWRSAVWSHAYAVLDEVDAGTRPMPTPEEAVSEMPPLELPA